MKKQEIANKIQTKRIVVTQQGSWKWQDAFRIATYVAKLADNGKVVWESVSQSCKFSEPQLRARGIDYPHGGLHNQQISKEVASNFIGKAKINMIEKHGWKFA